jgi:hypothetical protein
MLERSKAFFTRRDPQQGKLLPGYGLLYFDNLYGEYRSLPAERVIPEVKAIVDEILMKKQNASLAWDDLYTFDLLLARLQPPEKLPRKVWNLRSRYRDVAGLREYEAYLASKPPDLAGKAEELDLRADIEYLLGELHLRYAITPFREKTRDWLSKWVAYLTLIGLMWVVLFTVLANRGLVSIKTTTLTVVLFVGAMGGLVSMQQRFQSASAEGDPIHNVSELMHGWFSIFLSPISGAIFATVLYLIMTAGLLEGALFPKIVAFTPENSAKIIVLDFLKFLLETGPSTSADYAKLLVWSFIAGFAERFVPDTLSRFIVKKETDSKASA